MPLIKSPSKKAFQQNVATEMRAHPTQQSKNLAIAYNVQKKASSHHGSTHPVSNSAPAEPSIKCAHGGPVHCMEGCYAKGGMTDDERFNSVADAILHKHKAKMMAEGGEAMPDNDPQLDTFEDLDEEAAKKELYDEPSMKQPEASNERGDDIDSDEHDMVSSIRKKLKAKRS